VKFSTKQKANGRSKKMLCSRHWLRPITPEKANARKFFSFPLVPGQSQLFALDTLGRLETAASPALNQYTEVCSFRYKRLRMQRKTRPLPPKPTGTGIANFPVSYFSLGQIV
jgi:hypothetical protein